jgi:hypothetical protein
VPQGRLRHKHQETANGNKKSGSLKLPLLSAMRGRSGF